MYEEVSDSIYIYIYNSGKWIKSFMYEEVV